MDPVLSNRVNSDRDAYESQYGGAKVSKKLSPNSEIGVRFRSQIIDADYDAKSNPDYSVSLPTDVHRSLKKTQVGSVFIRQQISDAWSSTVDFSRSTTRYEELKNGLNNGRYDSHQSALNWANQYKVHANTSLTTGLDYIIDEHNEFNSFKLERRSVAGYAGVTQKLGLLTLQANLRRDLIDVDYQDNSKTTSLQPNATSTLVGAGYAINNSWKATATASTGFRAPSATEISNSPALKQEEYRSQELGLVYSNHQTLARFAYFQTMTHNAIDWFEDSQGQWTVKNAGEVENKGVEATLRTHWLGYGIKLSMVSQKPINLTDGYAPGRRAKNYGSVDVTKGYLDYELGAKWVASGARPDFNQVNSEMLAGYSIWSFYVSRKLTNEWTSRVRLENAFDRNYAIAGGYNTPGRGIFVTMQYQPK